jgi:osmotically-inducible protein OsmY
MKATLQAAIVVMAASAVAACDRHPQGNTAYNNSGQTAAVAGTAAPAPSESPSAGEPAKTSTATSDTASPNVARVAAPGADEQTSTKILAAITSDSGMKEANVSVTTENGVVKLGGNARSRDQVTLAMDIARRQPGVSAVESEIQVN